MKNRSYKVKKKFNFKLLYSWYMIFIGIFGQLVFFAQAYKIFTIQSALDISLVGFTAGLISVTSWLIYGIIIKDWPLIVANSIATLGAVMVVIGIIIYG
jgi:MtN3 and saliva related transmembrane protein